VIALTNLCQFIHQPPTAENLLQVQRVFHGRGHAYSGLEHVTIDWLPPVILITLFAPEPQTEVVELANKLRLIFPSCKSIQVQHRYELSAPFELIYGKALQQLQVQEGDLKFNIHLGKSKNTGLFLDMRNGRQWVKEQSKGKRVLNLFAYTCGFSVAALAGKAKSIVNIDMSSPALSVGRENHRLNNHNLEQVRFEKLNIFKSFSRLKKRGPFDLLICDPPTFQKGSVNIVQDYPKILRHLNEFMAPGSLLMLCLNAPELSRDFLMDNMVTLAPQYKLVEEIQPPTVFVDAENKGLKVLCFQQ
jgi:23S rRNA (cytosine1962-C5)-methyltransferase